MKIHCFCAFVALAGAARAAPGIEPKRPNLQKIAASLDGEYLSYSGPFGSRRIVNGATRIGLGDTKLALVVSQGTRKAGGEKFDATRASVSLSHDWSSRVSTRTYASIASDKP